MYNLEQSRQTYLKYVFDEYSSVRPIPIFKEFTDINIISIFLRIGSTDRVIGLGSIYLDNKGTGLSVYSSVLITTFLHGQNGMYKISQPERRSQAAHLSIDRARAFCPTS